MSAITATPVPQRLYLAGWLWFCAHSLLNVMPVVMAIGDKSSPLVVALATAAALAAMAVEGVLWRWATEAFAALRTPLGLAALAFLAFAAVSISWSIVPETSIGAYSEFVLTLAGAFILAFALPRRMPRQGPLYLATSIVIACLIIWFDLWADFPLRRILGVRAYDFIFNRSVLTLLVLTIPLLWLLMRWRHPWAAIGILVLVVATIFESASGAAVLGLLIAAVTYGLVRYSKRLAIWAIGMCLVAGVLLAPAMGTILDRFLPARVHEALAGAHSQIRVQIWKSFGEAVLREPLLGAGFGVSPHFAQTAVAQQIAPNDPSRYDVWHPHNAALQTWVELGGIGAALGLAVLLLVLFDIRSLAEAPQTVALMLFATVAAVSLVAHGAWQGWWAASIGAAIVWLRYGLHGPRETSP